MNRKLDGIYFRIKRNGRYENLCFTDLTEEERERVCENRSTEWLKGLAYHLADVIKILGEEFNIVCGDKQEE